MQCTAMHGVHCSAWGALLCMGCTLSVEACAHYRHMAADGTAGAAERVRKAGGVIWSYGVQLFHSHPWPCSSRAALLMDRLQQLGCTLMSRLQQRSCALYEPPAAMGCSLCAAPMRPCSNGQGCPPHEPPRTWSSIAAACSAPATASGGAAGPPPRVSPPWHIPTLNAGVRGHSLTLRLPEATGTQEERNEWQLASDCTHALHGLCASAYASALLAAAGGGRCSGANEYLAAT